MRQTAESPFSADEFISIPSKEKTKASTLKEIRAKYTNAYRPWKKEDDAKLTTLYKAGKTVKELTIIFQRNNGAIASRLRKLGMTE